MKIDEIVYCDKCENQIPLNPNPDNALELQLTGGYGMFIDLTEIDLIICHDCAVEFFRSIPQLSSDKINGMHSVAFNNKHYPICCEYGWHTVNNETVFGTKEDFDRRNEK